MIRRRRRRREIPFSFDSFLDVVANVCGIIIRLMLVVWVGARSYAEMKNRLEETAALPVAEVEDSALSPDPLEGALEEERLRLAEAEASLLAHLKDLDLAQGETTRRIQEQEKKAAWRRAQTRENEDAQRKVEKERQEVARVLPTLEELRIRARQLADEAKALEALPSASRELRYRTPVSRPVDAEELMFECQGGRVTFLDIAALQEEMKRTLRDKAELLKRTWEVDDTVGPIGPFRLRYTVQREREGLAVSVPDPQANFRYGVAGWRVEPVTKVRGETLEMALKPGSEFRQIADSLDGKYAAVTFWVYTDSFPLYRRLRDYLYERNVVVAGRPLPADASIASSRNGTISRGQ